MASDKTDQTSLRVCQSQGQARSATGHKALRAGESGEGEGAGAWAGRSLQLVGIARVRVARRGPRSRWPSGGLGPDGPQGAPGSCEGPEVAPRSCEGPGVAMWGTSWPPGPLRPGAGGEVPARLCKPDRPVGPALRPRAVPQGRGVVLGATVSQVHTCRPSVYAPVLERMERPRGSLDTGVRVQAEARWWLRCRLPVWGTVETGHKRWGWQSQRGWGRRFGRRPTREPGAAGRGGRRGPGSPWGVRAGQWGRGQARGVDSGSLEPGGPGPSQTLRFRRRVAQARVARCGLMEKGRAGSLSSWVSREAPGSLPPAEIPCRSPVSYELSARKERQEAGNVCLQQLLGQGEG